ncbi:hypothetical protein LTR29_016816 [Friedmanniomyces endolithicus]|nr:hypothetical protein LTR29_016816 [Friedmanniomyces endolithicus]
MLPTTLGQESHHPVTGRAGRPGSTSRSSQRKVYVFCFEFGYAVTIWDPMLTLLTCMVTITLKDLPEMTTTPDIVLAEMMVDGTMIYIDTLAMDGVGRLPKSMDKSICPIKTEKPHFIYRTVWDRMPTKIELEFEPTPSDGVVLTNKFRTMRLKQPTIDLLFMDGKLNGIENGVLIPLTDGHANMDEDTVYEMDVVKDEETNALKIVRPRERPLKEVTNSMDVIKRAIASATADVATNTILIDIVSMSFSMRERVYLMAQAKAPSNRKVIVSFGVGRFQEWKQMLNDGFSYIAVDPELDYKDLERRAKRIRILPYDFNRSFNTQVLSISKGMQTVLWAKCRSEDFIRRASVPPLRPGL